MEGGKRGILKMLTLFVIYSMILLPVAFAFQISDVEADPTATSVTISWRTDELSDSVVAYGPGDLDSTESNSEMVLFHQISVQGLLPDTRYTYVVASRNSSGDKIESTTQSFTTLDNTPPGKVQNLTNTSTSETEIGLAWSRVVADDLSHYNLYRDNSKVGETSQTSYQDTLVQAGRSYTYKVSAVDTSNNEGQTSDPITISTPAPDTTPPTIINMSPSSISITSATIGWVTDEEANSSLSYGETPALGNNVHQAAFTTQHSVSISGLSDSTKYYYKARSCDRSGNCAESDMKYFIAGAELTPPPIEIDVPETANSGILRVTGSTRPFSKLTVSVNDHAQLTLPEVSSTGDFAVDVRLDVQHSPNTLKFDVEDVYGNRNSATATVVVDVNPPALTVEDILEVTDSSELNLRGSVNEQVTIEVYVDQYDIEDLEPPAKIQELQGRQAGQTIALDWQASQEPYLAKYLIYRSDVGLIGESSTSNFVDMNISNGTYSYQVSAMDANCNEGDTSNTVSVSAVEIVYGKSAHVINKSCGATIPTRTFSTSGPFSESITLKEGTNSIRVVARDSADNTAEVDAVTFVDSRAPSIRDTNLGELSPSYIQEIVVRGTVDENATVVVFVNGRTYIDTESIADDYITRDKMLEIIKQHGTIESQDAFDTLTTGDNDFNYMGKTNELGYFELNVYLDRIYNQSSDYSGDNWATGSGGSALDSGEKWENDVKVLVIDRVGHTADQSSKVDYTLCGFGADWNIQVGDITPTSLNPRMILEGMAQIGFAVNLSWQGPGPEPQIVGAPSIDYPALSREAMEHYYDTTGWVSQRNSNHWTRDGKYGYITLNFKHDPVPFGTNWTYFDREDNISQHRAGTCFNMATPGLDTLPGTGSSYMPDDVGCVRVPLMLTVYYENENYLDPTRQYNRPQKQCWDVEIMIDPRVDPGHIPESFLNSSINFLNATIDIIDRLYKPIRTVTQYTIIACVGFWAGWFISKFGELSSCVGIGFNKCDCSATVAGENGVNCVDIPNGPKGDECVDCYKAKLRTAKVWTALHWVCDRVSCPPIPSFDSYVLEKRGENREQQDADDDVIITSHCQASSIDPITYYTEGKSETNDYCANKRILPQGGAVEECCDDEYRLQWNSGCLGMDEFKESKCLAVANMDDAKLESYGLAGEATDLECGGWRGLFNYVADMKLCGGDNSSDEIQAQFGGQWFVMKKQETAKGDMWKAWLGTPTRTVHIREGVTTREEFDVAKGKEVDISDEQCEDYVKGNLRYDVGKWPRYESTDNIVINIIDGREDRSSTRGGKSEPVPQSIVSQVCTGRGSQREYVVDPTSGLLRSIQCGCFSAITSYLAHYRQILSVIKNCFEQILYTGDGSSGVCQAAISTYICDLIYHTISCITDRPGPGYGSEMSGGGIGIIKYLANAGSEVREGVMSRYGETSLVQTVFVENRLMHAVCVAAFTGDWDIDWQGVVDSSIHIPIESTVTIWPAERQFMTYNPINSYASHVYHVGAFILSGADEMRYTITLVCSSSNDCDPEYFENGYCDCAFGQERKFNLNSYFGNGGLTQGQVLNEEKFIQIRGDTDQFGGSVRYDKVEIEYKYRSPRHTMDRGEWLTKTVEKKITQTGQVPPECEFDVGSLSYKCGWGQDGNGTAYFQGEPTSQKSLYGTGDRLDIVSNIMVDYPGDIFQRYWLEVDVRNQRGASLGGGTQQSANTPVSYDLAYEGLHTITKPDWEIEEWMFGLEGSGSSCLSPIDLQGLAQINSVRNNGASGDFKVSYDGTSWKYERGTYTSGTFSPSGSPVNCGPYENRRVTCNNVELVFNSEPEEGSVVISCPRGTGGAGYVCDGTERPWYATFTLLKEDSAGGRTVVYKDRVEQKKQISFNVRCAATDSVVCTHTDGYTPNDNRCDCDGNGIQPEPGYDCDGNKIYCYEQFNDDASEGYKCEETPACKFNTLYTTPCDCNRDGVTQDVDGSNKKYCCDRVAQDGPCDTSGGSSGSGTSVEFEEIKIHTDVPGGDVFAGDSACILDENDVKIQVSVNNAQSVDLYEGSQKIVGCEGVAPQYTCNWLSSSYTIPSGDNVASKRLHLKATSGSGSSDSNSFDIRIARELSYCTT